MSAASVEFARRQPEPYNGPRELFLLDRDLAKLETYVYSTIPHLATKKDLSDAEGRLDNKIETVRTEIQTVRTEIQTVRTEIESVRTDVQKEQKKLRSLLLTIGGGIIATIVGTSFFGGKEAPVIYVPQPVPEHATVTSLETISTLNELREFVMELKQSPTTKAEPEH